MAFKLAWASCDGFQWPTPGWDRIREHGPKIVIAQGDTPYTNGSSSGLFGVTTSPAFSATTTQADAFIKFQQFWAKPSAARLLALRASGMLFYYQADDHEWSGSSGNDWDHSVAGAGGAPSGYTTQAQVNTHWQRSNDARIEFLAASADNPTPDAASNTERPANCTAEAQNPATTNYPICYFYRDYDSAGNLGGTFLRVIHTDNISYRSLIGATDDSSKRMLGAQQEAWLIALLNDSTGFQHVVVSSTKKLFRASGGVSDNQDTFGNYTTERARILSAIDASGVKPIWISGDRHSPHVAATRKSTGGLCDIIDICACPIGVAVNYLGPTFHELLWKGERQSYGLLTFSDAGLTAEMRDASTGSVTWAASFAPRSNLPIYTDATTAVRVGA